MAEDRHEVAQSLGYRRLEGRFGVEVQQCEGFDYLFGMLWWQKIVQDQLLRGFTSNAADPWVL